MGKICTIILAVIIILAIYFMITIYSARINKDLEKFNIIKNSKETMLPNGSDQNDHLEINIGGDPINGNNLTAANYSSDIYSNVFFDKPIKNNNTAPQAYNYYFSD